MNEIGVGSGGVALTVVPRDIAESGRWEVIVAGVEKVVIQEAGHHTPKVLERRDDHTGIAWRRKLVSGRQSIGVCVYCQSRLYSPVHFPRGGRWR